MEFDVVLFWLLCFSCLSGLAVALRMIKARSGGPGWAAMYLVILVVALIGWFREQKTLIYAAGVILLLFVVLPGLLAKLYYRRFLQQRFRAARWLARVNSWLHPADGWRQQPEIVRAVELAQAGDLTAASEAIDRYRQASSPLSLAFMPTLYRLTNQWDDLITWETQHHEQLERLPELLHGLLRARGETGDLRGLVELYDRRKSQIAKLVPAASRDLCRLMLFAFCGERGLAERLLRGSLAVLPLSTRKFWLATADLAGGAHDEAKRQLEALLPQADQVMRVAIGRRLARIAIQPELPASAESVITNASIEQGHEERFGARYTLFSPSARASQIIILLNVLMFALELFLGGVTNMEVFYRLGGVVAPAVQAGEWWRLVAALFLHFGALHLVMNMLALWVLGPFVEASLGARRFLVVYLLAGIGSMGVVVAFSSGVEQMTVGASGCIMGLVGATGALMLRGWVRERALIARRRLTGTLAIVAIQTAFDALIPHVSMTAHLSGVIIGFAATMMLRDRLTGSKRGGMIPEKQRGQESARA